MSAVGLCWKKKRQKQTKDKKTKVAAPIQLRRCLARWTTLSEFLPVVLPTQTSLKKKEENKRTGTSPVATCLEYVSHCGAGSTLTAHNHPSVPVVAAAVAEALYSSPLAGYRSADSLSCGRVGGQRGLGEGARRWNRPDGGGEHAAVDTFAPAAQRRLISSHHSSFGECKWIQMII